MLRTLRAPVSILACLLFVACAQAQDQPPALKVGDPAPALVSGKFIKGEPVTQLEKGRLYVVEFWATWCAPCRQSIPHVSALQKKFPDVVFIGQDCLEEDPSQVSAFVQQMGDQMSYRVALDDISDGGGGKMAQTWLAAAGQNGIPCAFIVDREGRVAWIGHPMTMERTLEQIVAGAYDIKKAGEQLEKLKEAERRFKDAQQSGDDDRLLAVIDEISAQMPEVAGQMARAKFGVLLKKKDFPAAYAQAAEAGKLLDDNPDALNEIAWTIADAPGLENRDLDVALKLATRACELTKNQRGDIIDTVARIYFDKGDLDKAIKLQTEAVAKVPEGPLRQQLQKTLDLYKSKQRS